LFFLEAAIVFVMNELAQRRLVELRQLAQFQCYATRSRSGWRPGDRHCKPSQLQRARRR
jgi:hypothetical protein